MKLWIGEEGGLDEENTAEGGSSPGPVEREIEDKHARRHGLSLVREEEVWHLDQEHLTFF